MNSGQGNNKKIFLPTYSSSEDKQAMETGNESASGNAQGKRAPENHRKGSQNNTNVTGGYKAQQKKGKKTNRGDMSSASTALPYSMQSEISSSNDKGVPYGMNSYSSRVSSSEDEKGQFARAPQTGNRNYQSQYYGAQQYQNQQQYHHQNQYQNHHQYQHQPNQYNQRRQGYQNYNGQQALNIETLPHKGIKVVCFSEVILEDPHRKLSYLSSSEERNSDQQDGPRYASSKYFLAPNPKDIPLPSFVDCV